MNKKILLDDGTEMEGYKARLCAMLLETTIFKKCNLTIAYDVPIWKKANLTIEEASAYFGIGMNKLRELTEDENCKFVLYIGSKRLIKRQMFEKYLEQAYSL